jgi:ATP/maltotriose-dependent transcriptional regulator MalT/ActR/RegA family two-component response regulator
MPTKILLVDDHPMFRKGLRLLLEEEPDLQVVAEAGNGREALDRSGACAPDLVVMDITMPDMNGIEATRKIVAAFPHIKIVALSIHAEKKFVQEMLQAGAAGYLLKDSVPEEIIDSIRAVMQDKVYLSASIAGIVVTEYVKVLSKAAELEEKPAQEPDDATLLRTKLHPTPLTWDLIPRTHLVNKFDNLRRRPFTLVSAPAGYGKSTMASLWLKTWNGPRGWVSLEKDENDLRIFMTYLLAAIQSSQGAGFSTACESTRSLIEAPGLPPAKVLSRHLINDLDEIETPFILVLDDYHEIRDPNVHELVSGLMNHPSRSMHLMLLTRRDPPLPIGRLRGRGQINEIGMFQLRFKRQETTLFLNQSLGLSVDDNTATSIHEKLEGWAAGMRLMSHSLRNRKDVMHLVNGLKGSFRSIVEYLMAEVLTRQPAEMAKHMVETALLDRFCAPVCDAMRSRDPGSAKGRLNNDGIGGRSFIAHLKTNNLFLIPLDAEGRWYRYHHLFQDLLLAQLKKRYSAEEIADCHSRASEWFAENDFISEALQHALAAGDMPRAIDLIETHRQAKLNSERWYVFEKWLGMLPDSEIERRPELMMAKVWTCYFQSKNEIIPPLLDSVASLLSNKPKEQPLYGEIYLFKGVFSFWQGDISSSVEYIKNALERIPEAQPMVRGFAEIYFGLAGHTSGQTDHVLPVLSDLLNHPSMESQRQLRIIVALVWVHILSGDMVAAELRNRQLTDAALKNNSAAFISWRSYNQGVIHFYRNEFDSAIHCFNEAAKDGYLIINRANVDCLAGLALTYQAMQQTDKAEQTLARVFELIDSLKDPTLLEIAHACEGRLSLMRGEAVPALRLPHPAQASDGQPMVFWLEVPAITNCRVLIADGSDTSLMEAEKRLTSYLRLNRTHHNTVRVIELMALQSQAVGRQGRLEEALTLLGQAIKLAKPGGCVQPFVELGPPMADLLKQLRQQNVAVDTINRILDFSSDSEPIVAPVSTDHPGTSADQPPHPSTSSQHLVEPLTNRELDVLELLAKRLQNKEIAEKLFVSNQTVKTHLKNIYQKLSVSTRRQAVTQACRLGIITRR